MSNAHQVNRPAPLKNVAAFSTLITKVVERKPHLPGMAVFCGPSGYGKSRSAIYGAGRYRAAYVECDQFTTAKSLLVLILKEIGIDRPKGTVPDLIEQAVMVMAGDVRRPLIVDEAHHIAAKRFVDVGRKIVEDPQSGDLEIAQLGSPRRLRTIYWANTRTAHAAGEWDRTQRNKRFLPFLVYTRSPAERRRLEHEGWVGRVLPVDHTWWHTHYPPNGWGCQCGVRQIARAEALRLGYDETAPAPAVETRRWLNKRTGVWEHVPVGIDPGWANNPGITRGVNASRFLLDQVAAMPAYRRATAIADIAGSPILKAMVEGKMPVGAFLPVAPIPARLVEAMGSPGSLARLSADSVKHIIEERAERQLSVGVLRAAIKVLAAGQIIARRGNSAIVLGEADGRWWRVVVKAAMGGREWWLTSFHAKSASDIPAIIRRERAAGNLIE